MTHKNIRDIDAMRRADWCVDTGCSVDLYSSRMIGPLFDVIDFSPED